MATIAENLQTIKDSTAAIKQSLISKGVKISGNIATWASEIDKIETGGGGGEVSTLIKKDVNLYDYDGTILHSFLKDEFLALSSLPDLPTREGLTCQGWNYTLANAQSYVSDYGKLDIGATCITDDGCTRLYIRIAAEGRMDVPVYINQTVSGGVVIDWGDNSPTETLSGTGNVSGTHTYAQTGDYVISLRVASGTLGLGHRGNGYCVLGSVLKRAYTNMLQKVEIGSGVIAIDTYAFNDCYSLASISISNSVTSIDTYAFDECYSLASVVIPNSVTSIGNYAFRDCYSLASIVVPNSVTSIGNYAFYDCYSLSSIVIPNGVTSIGTYTFFYCHSLASIVIPNSVTSIGDYTFDNCRSLASISISNSVTSIGGHAFSDCYSLASIVIPNSVTSIGYYAFDNCRSLASIVVPNSVTSIGNYTFENCRSLSSIVIPNSVTSIGNYAFRYCDSIAFYDFTSHTAIPKLSNTNSFNNIASDCEIRVPATLVDGWKAATNWSTYADKIVGY